MNWISIQDEFPEMHQRVITWTLDADDVYIVSMAIWNGAYGFLSHGGCRDRDVTHWMPLPEPPESHE